ncbi:MAG TPA: hypothetical protein VMF12_13020 [Xanthobacteraceae bacterium]|nr:hypothetical protein [Xanthobacteraceae bacterium]
MITKWKVAALKVAASKVAALAVLAAVSVASPALAQSAYTTGTAADSANAGYPSSYRGPYAYAPDSVSLRTSGYGSFAMVPGGYAPRGYGSFDMVPGTNGGRYSPSATGGGNPGYNWSLENDY